MTAATTLGHDPSGMTRQTEPAGPGEASERPLSLWLRQQSAGDHLWLEEKIGLDQAPMSRARYGTMLLMFRALHGLTDKLREIFAAAYGAYAFQPSRTYDAAIAHDLAEIGWKGMHSGPSATMTDRYPSFADALGAFYVAEGSALGNVLLLRQSEAWSELPSGTATQFLSESAGQAAQRFQAFKARLDDFGLREPEARDRVLAGARRTFRACGDLIDGLSQIEYRSGIARQPVGDR